MDKTMCNWNICEDEIIMGILINSQSMTSIGGFIISDWFN